MKTTGSLEVVESILMIQELIPAPMKDTYHQLQQMIDAISPTKRYMDMMEMTSAARQFARLQEANFPSSTLLRLQETAQNAARVRNDLLGSSAIAAVQELVKASEHNLTLQADLMESFGPALEDRLLMTQNVLAVYRSQFQGFQDLVAGFLSTLPDVDALIRPFGSFVELDAEDDQEEEDEHRLILPEDFRGQVIEVRAIPLRVMNTILRNPMAIHELFDSSQFEAFIAQLVDSLGGKDVKILGGPGDYGLDVIASFLVGGVYTLIGYQCKKYRPGRNVSGAAVRELFGAISLPRKRAHKGVLCTTSDFQPQAKRYFAQVVQLTGWGPDDIAGKLRKGGTPY